MTLLVLAGWLAFEAIRRLIHPPAVAGQLVLITAPVGIMITVAATWMISRANRTSLNVEGAFQHILTDLFAFIATAIAGVVIMFTGFARADAIATLVVVTLMLKAGLGLVRASNRIFFEAAPQHLDPVAIGQAMANREAVVEVHDLHVWEITSGSPALSAHVLVERDRNCHAARVDVARLLASEHNIDHSTLQVDHVGSDTAEEGDHHCEEPHGPTHRSTDADAMLSQGNP